MKVTFVIWVIVRTGGVRVLLKVANGLVERGHDVNIVTLTGESCFPLKAKIQTRMEVPTTLRLLDIINIWRLAKNLPDSDITVATFYPVAYSVFLGGNGVPFYYIQHYEAIGYMNGVRMLDPLFRHFVDITYRIPFNWIVNSTWVKNILKRRFGKNGYLVNPGIDLDVFYPREVERKRDTKTVLSLGKSAPFKGLQNAFEAMKIVRRRFQDVKLILYGSEPYLETLSPVPCEYLYKPSDEELAKLYSSADVVIAPSWYESFPLPPLEAMACGAPVVTTRYGTEDYAIDDVNSLVVPPRNPEAFAKAILRVLSDEALAERLKKAGLQTAREFTWERTLNKVEDAFRRALKSA